MRVAPGGGCRPPREPHGRPADVTSPAGAGRKGAGPPEAGPLPRAGPPPGAGAPPAAGLAPAPDAFGAGEPTSPSWPGTREAGLAPTPAPPTAAGEPGTNPLSAQVTGPLAAWPT